VLHLLSEAPKSLARIEMVDPPGREQYVYWVTSTWIPPSLIEGVALHVRFSHLPPGFEEENRKQEEHVQEIRMLRRRTSKRRAYGEMDELEFEK